MTISLSVVISDFIATYAWVAVPTPCHPNPPPPLPPLPPPPFCRTCFSMGDLGVQVSVRPSVRSSFCQHLPWVSCERNSSYSFVLIILKFCICFLHGMKICMSFGYKCWIIFCHFFRIVNLVIFHPQYIDSGYLLWAQLLLQFYTDCYETLHSFSSWYEDVHVVWV